MTLPPITPGGPAAFGSNETGTYRWATVVDTDPLAVRLDGDVDPLPMVPDTLVYPYRMVVGSRVWVQLFYRRIVILGVYNAGVSQGLGALPGGYAQITANTSGNANSTTPVDVAGLSVSVTVAPNRQIKITAEGLLFSSVAADQGALIIMEGSTQLTNRQGPTLTSSNRGYTVTVTARVTPSAGAHTYKVACSRISGTGNINVSASAGAPAFILVEDIGSA